MEIIGQHFLVPPIKRTKLLAEDLFVHFCPLIRKDNFFNNYKFLKIVKLFLVYYIAGIK